MKEPMMADSHEITVRNYKQPMRNRLVMMLICIGIALASFFVVSKWATSVESYRWVIKTLNGLQKKALGLSGTATALATGAAAIFGTTGGVMEAALRTAQDALTGKDLEKIGNLSLLGDIDLKYRTIYYLINIL